MSAISALYVEDDPIVQRTLVRVLKMMYRGTVDLSLTPVDTLEKAKSVLSTKSFDLIMSDVMLPDGTGVDLHTWVTENLVEYEGRFIFCSGGLSAELKSYIQNSGCPFLAKPITVVELKEVWDRILQVENVRKSISAPRFSSPSQDGDPPSRNPKPNLCA